MNTEKLLLRVTAINKANRYAREVYKSLVELFGSLVGEKIMKSDGSLLKKYQDQLPTFSNTHDLMVYRLDSDYSAIWVVKSCESTAQNCVYHETQVNLGRLDNGVLVELRLTEPSFYREDFTVEEIFLKRLSYTSAKRVADNLRNDLFPFGEWD